MFLMAYGGVWAVAGVGDEVGGEGVEFLADAFGEEVEIAGGEVGAANAAVEEHIADNDKLCGLTHQADMSVNMSGGIENFEGGVAEFHLIAFVQESLRFNNFVQLNAKHTAMNGGAVQNFQRFGMYHRAQSVGAENMANAKHMINMTVGVKVGNGFHVVLGDKMIQLPLLGCVVATGINNHTFARFVVNQVGILLKSIKNQSFNFNHFV